MEHVLLAGGSGMVLGGLAAIVLATPGGWAAGAIYGISAALSGLVVSNITFACFNPLGQRADERSPVTHAVKIVGIVLGLIASIAAGYGILTLLSIPITLGAAVMLHLTIGMIALLIIGAIGAITLGGMCLCGD